MTPKPPRGDSPKSAKPAPQPSQVPPPAPCKRCHQPRALDDDGFCDDCRRKLEEACL